MRLPQTDNDMFNEIRNEGTPIVSLLNSSKAKVIDTGAKSDPEFIAALSHEVATLDKLRQKVLFMYALFILATPTVLQVFVEHGVKIMTHHLIMVLDESTFQFDNSIRFHSFQYFRRIQIRVNVVKFLLSHISFDARETIRTTLSIRLDLFKLFYNNSNLVRVLVEEHIIPPLNIADVRRIFLRYIINGYLTTNILQCLISFGLPLNDTSGYPIHLAIKNNQIDIFQLLIANGWILDVVDENGNTPLHFAYMRGKHQFIRAMLPTIVEEDTHVVPAIEYADDFY